MRRSVLLMLIAATASGIATAAGEVRLVADGRPMACITLPHQASEAERTAAHALRMYIGKVTGADVPLGEGMPVHIYLGRAAAFTDLPFAPPKLEAEHFLMRTHGSDLYLLGADDAAVSHAVYTLLRELGCRWFMPGEIGEVIPHMADVAIGPVNRIEGPDFSLRNIWFSWDSRDPLNTPDARARAADWSRRNRTGGASVFMSHNLVHGPLPPDTYFKEHPEYYALVNGVRVPRQPCTSNPEVIEIVARAANAYFDEHPEAISYSLSPEDNADFCQCANCIALDSGARDPGFSNYPVVTDRLVKFYNAVAERVQEKRPGKCIAFYAYFNHTLPPTTVRLNPNVLVSVTAQQFCTLHSVTDRGCASRRKMAGIVGEYARQTKHVYIREYDPMPGSHELPVPLFGAHVRDMPWYKRVGVRGFSWESHQSWATLLPNHYVLAQMMWDADQDPKALLADFYDKFFGPAAAPMARYYDRMEHALSGSETHPGWGTDELPLVFTDGVVNECRRALLEAISLARSSPYRGRVQMVTAGFRYLDSWLAFNRALVAQDYDTATAAKARATRTLEVMSALNPDFILLSEAEHAIREADEALSWILPKSAEFRRANDVIDLPDVWRFRREENERTSAAWADPEYDDADWGTVRVDSQWWEQMTSDPPLENCRAWVRVRFDAPASFRGRRVMLRFGALDEEGWIYVNGRLVHRRQQEGENWDQPFEVEITDAVRCGERNLLAVRAQAGGTLGGVWRRAVVYSPRP